MPSWRSPAAAPEGRCRRCRVWSDSFLGVESAPIRFERDGVTWSVKASSLVDMAAVGAMGINPNATEPLHLENTGHPAADRFALARASKSHVHALGFAWDDVERLEQRTIRAVFLAECVALPSGHPPLDQPSDPRGHPAEDVPWRSAPLPAVVVVLLLVVVDRGHGAGHVRRDDGAVGLDDDQRLGRHAPSAAVDDVGGHDGRDDAARRRGRCWRCTARFRSGNSPAARHSSHLYLFAGGYVLVWALFSVLPPSSSGCLPGSCSCRR